MNEKIKKSLLEIREDIKKYSPYPDKVRLVAVTKYSEVDDMLEALGCGADTFGENKAQLLKEKKTIFDEKNISNVHWHFIGNLQSNKVKYIIDYVELIHSVNRLSLAQEINDQAKKHDRIVNILLEVNIYGEESKEGYDIDQLKRDAEALTKMKNINIIGLMTMAPFTEDQKILHYVFSELSKLKDHLNERYFKNELTELSMGMSNDYKIALEEGATLIRVGSKIFK